MFEVHQCKAPGPWLLGPRVAVSLRAQPVERGLWVHEGRVWLTTEGQAQDVWLQAGQGHTLPAGSRWVAEAWPQARVSLVQAPAFGRATASRSLSSRLLRSWLCAAMPTLRRLLGRPQRTAAC